MEKYKVIHDSFQTLLALSKPFFTDKDEDELYPYVSTCAAKIWAQNDQRYSPVYIQALKACSGLEHDEPQMRAVLATLADPRYYPLTPEFFENMVKEELRRPRGMCEKFLSVLQTLLLELARANGDLTFDEASMADQIIGSIFSFCYAKGLRVPVKKIQFQKYLTELNESSYKESIASVEDVTFDIKEVFNRDKEDGSAFDITFHSDEDDDKKPAEEKGETKKPAKEKREYANDLEGCLAELYDLTGLRAVKEEITNLVNLTRVQQIRASHGFSNAEVSLHLVFAGNPGTGKTTVARILARIYKALGILPSDNLVEVDRSGLVAGYVGQTAIKTKEVIDSAIGGVLFIDEAYSLTPERSENDYGKEAIDTLLKAMEDHRDELVVIVAGYTDLMGKFIESNPGLKSRFNRYIYFEDYAPEELLEIFHKQAAKNDYLMEPECDALLLEFFGEMQKRGMADFGNARGARNLFEKTITAQAARVVRMSNPSADDVQRITTEDIQESCRKSGLTQ